MSAPTKFNVPLLAKELAKQTGHPPADWESVMQRGLEGLRGADIDLDALEKIARASKTPRQFAWMVRLISQYCRSHGTGRHVFVALFKARDGSVFSLSEWVESLEYFGEFLESRNQPLDFSNMLNYLQCATQLPDAKTPGAKLLATLQGSIEKYGISWLR